MKKLNLFLFFFVSFINSFSQTDSVPGFIKDSLDIYVNRALSDWQIPGAAVCVVKDGKIVVMKGYGVREAGKDDKVDENTLFMIGSNTKAFTATALAMLDANKILSLDDKVKKWLPDFKLHDPWVANEANIKDLLCHRLGFETFQGDFMFFDSDLTLQQVRQKFGMLKPIYSFRSKWGYTNAAFMIAGEIIPRAVKKSWAEFMRDSIFIPLEMNRTLALSKEIQGATNKASAHTVVDGAVRKIPYGSIDNLAPAGSMSSSVSDMSRWLMFQIDNGKYKGRQIVPGNAMGITRTPHSVIGNGGSLYNRGHFSLYGLGWVLEEYAGRKVQSHTGGVNGFVTSVTLLREENLGILVFTNTDANSFYESLKWEIMDAYLGLPYRNYSKVHLGFHQNNEAGKTKQLQLKRDTIAMNMPATLPLKSYAGNYVHPVYGNMTITYEESRLGVVRSLDGKLTARFEHHKGRFAALEPLGQNRFLATFNEPLFGIKVWPFTVVNGKVQSVTVTVADFVEFTPYEFVKK